MFQPSSTYSKPLARLSSVVDGTWNPNWVNIGFHLAIQILDPRKDCSLDDEESPYCKVPLLWCFQGRTYKTHQNFMCMEDDFIFRYCALVLQGFCKAPIKLSWYYIVPCRVCPFTFASSNVHVLIFHHIYVFIIDRFPIPLMLNTQNEIH
jgi:hypothetical protein